MSPARTVSAASASVGRAGLPRACAEPADSLQRLASRLDDHADQLAAGNRADRGGRVAGVRAVASAVRLGAARLRAGTLPTRRERSR